MTIKIIGTPIDDLNPINSIVGDEKLPTNKGLYYLTPDQIKDYILDYFSKESIHLSNVDNTSDLDKPLSTAAKLALAKKLDINSNLYVRSIQGKTGDVVLSKSDLNLGQVDNTSDLDKPISTATELALESKVNFSEYVALRQTFTDFESEVKTFIAEQMCINESLLSKLKDFDPSDLDTQEIIDKLTEQFQKKLDDISKDLTSSQLEQVTDTVKNWVESNLGSNQDLLDMLNDIDSNIAAQIADVEKQIKEAKDLTKALDQAAQAKLIEYKNQLEDNKQTIATAIEDANKIKQDVEKTTSELLAYVDSQITATEKLVSKADQELTDRVALANEATNALKNSVANSVRDLNATVNDIKNITKSFEIDFNTKLAATEERVQDSRNYAQSLVTNSQKSLNDSITNTNILLNSLTSKTRNDYDVLMGAIETNTEYLSNSVNDQITTTINNVNTIVNDVKNTVNTDLKDTKDSLEALNNLASNLRLDVEKYNSDLIKKSNDLDLSIKQEKEDRIAAISKEIADRNKEIQDRIEEANAEIMAAVNALDTTNILELNNKIDALNTKIDNNSAALTQETKDYVNGKISEVNTTINTKVLDLVSKISDETADRLLAIQSLSDGVDSKITILNDKDTEILESINNFKTSTNNSFSNINDQLTLISTDVATNASKITTLDSSLKSQGDSLASAVSKLNTTATKLDSTASSLDSLTATVNSNDSTVRGLIANESSTRSTEIGNVTSQLNVLQSTFNTLSVGGQNLLKKSNTALVRTGSNYLIGSYDLGLVLTAGETYTLIVNITQPNDGPSDRRVVAFQNDSGLLDLGTTRGKSNQVYIKSFSAAANVSKIGFYYYPTTSSAGSATVNWAVLVKGTSLQINDWIQSPYDVSDSFVATDSKISNLQTTVTNADTALSQSISTLDSKFTTKDTEVRGLITSEASTRSTAIGNLTTKLEALESDYKSVDSNFSALLATETQARTSSDEALSQRLTTFQSSFSGNGVNILSVNTTDPKNTVNLFSTSNLTTSVVDTDRNVKGYLLKRNATGEARAHFSTNLTDYLVNVSQGNYILSTYIKSGLSTTVVKLGLRLSNGTYLQGSNITLSTSWQRISYVFSIPANVSYCHPVLYVDVNSQAVSTNNVVTVSNLMMEKQVGNGTSPSDWVSGVNDTNANITSLEKTLTDANTALSTKVTDLTTTVNTNDTNVKSLITNEATSRSTADQALTTQLNALSTTVSTNDTTVKGLIATESTNRTTAIGNVTTQLNTLSSSFNSLTIGGTNLVKNTSNTVKSTVATSLEKYFDLSLNSLEINKVYTVRFVVSDIVNTSLYSLILMGSYNNTDRYYIAQSASLTSGEIVINFTLTKPITGTPVKLRFVNETKAADSSFNIINVKLEQGSKPSDWSPSPEDISSALLQVQSNINSLATSTTSADQALSTKIDTVNSVLATVPNAGVNLINSVYTNFLDLSKIQNNGLSLFNYWSSAYPSLYGLGFNTSAFTNIVFKNASTSMPRLLPGKYLLSFYAYTNEGGGKLSPRLMGESEFDVLFGNVLEVELTSTLTRYSCLFTVTQEKDYSVMFYINGLGTVRNFRIERPMLEQVLANNTLASTWVEGLSNTSFSLSPVKYSEAKLASKVETLTTDQLATATKLDTLTTTVSNNDTQTKSLIASETTSRSTADTALGKRIDTLSSDLSTANSDLNSKITSEQTARVSADSALTSRLDSLTSTVTSNNTTITGKVNTLEQTVSTLDSNTSTRFNTLESSFNALPNSGINLIPLEISNPVSKPSYTSGSTFALYDSTDTVKTKGWQVTTTSTSNTAALYFNVGGGDKTNASLFLPVGKYVFSFYGKTLTGTHNISWDFINSTTTVTTPVFTLSTTLTRYSFIVDITTARKVSICLNTNKSGVNSVTYQIEKMMLEVQVKSSTNPSIWVPGNSDVSGQIVSTNAAVSSLTTTVSNNNTAISNRVDSLTTTVTNNNTNTNARIDSTNSALSNLDSSTTTRFDSMASDYNSKFSTTNSSITQLQTTLNSADSALSSKIDDLRTGVTSIDISTNSSITNLQKSISDESSSRVNALNTLQADLNTKDLNLKSLIAAETEARVNSDSSIASSISTLQSSFSGNGNNLLPINYSDPSSLPVLSLTSVTASIVPSELRSNVYSNAYKFKPTATSTNTIRFGSSMTDYDTLKISSGSFIVSFYAKAATAGSPLTVGLKGNNNVGYTSSSIVLTTSYVRYSSVITIPNSVTNLGALLYFIINSDSKAVSETNYVLIDMIMIEKQIGTGTTPSVWTAGSSNVNSVISTVAKTASDANSATNSLIDSLTSSLNTDLSTIRSDIITNKNTASTDTQAVANNLTSLNTTFTDFKTTTNNAISGINTSITNINGSLTTQSNSLTALESSLQSNFESLNLDPNFVNGLKYYGTVDTSATNIITAGNFGENSSTGVQIVKGTSANPRITIFNSLGVLFRANRTYRVIIKAKSSLASYTILARFVNKSTSAVLQSTTLTGTNTNFNTYTADYKPTADTLVYIEVISGTNSSTLNIDSVKVIDYSETLANSTNATAISNLTTRTTTAEGKITSQGNDITSLQNSVATKASAQAVNDLSQVVTVQGDNITSQGSRITTLENTVNDGISGVAATASSLATLTNKVNQQGSDITSSSADIVRLDNSIKNIKVGGRNWLKNSSFEKDLSNWTLTTPSVCSIVSVSDSINSVTTCLKITSTASNQGLSQPLLFKEVNTSIVVSFWAKSDIEGSSLKVGTTGHTGTTVVVLSKTWKRYVIPLIKTASLPDFNIYTNTDVSDNYYISRVQYEVGTLVTDWEMSDWDFQNQIDVTSSALSSLTSTVTSQGNTLTSQGTNIVSLQNSLNGLTIGGRNLVLNSSYSIKTVINSSTAYEVYFNLSETTFKPNEELTVQFEISDIVNTSSISVILMGQYNSADRLTIKSGAIQSGFYTGTVKLINTFYNSSNRILRIVNETKSSDSSFKITRVKLERGNKATDWSPAPEDVQSQVDANANAVSTLNNTVTSQGGVITSQGSDITSLKNSVTSINSTLNTKADASALNTLTNRVTTAENSLTTQSGSITTLTNTINSLSVGGTNFLTASEAVRSMVGTNTSNQVSNKTYFVSNKSLKDFNLTTSDFITLSFDWEITGSTISGTFRPQFNAVPWANSIGSISVTVSSTNTKGRYVCTGPVTASFLTSDAKSLDIRGDSLQGTLSIKRIKLEKGNFATDWSPAPEDLATANALSSLNTTVTQQGDTIVSQGQAINSLRNDLNTTNNTKADSTAVSALSSLVNTIDGKVTSNSSSITALENNVSIINSKGANLIDGSFETLTNINSGVAVASSTRRSGTKSLKFTRLKDTNSGVNEDVYFGDWVAIGEQRTFYVEYWARNDPDMTVAPATNSYAKVGLFTNTPSGSGDWRSVNVRIDQLTSTWVKISGYLTTPAGHNKAKLWVSIASASTYNLKGVALLIDDVYITDVTEGKSGVDAGAANATAITNLTNTVTTQGNSITSQSGQITTLQNSIQTINSNLDLKANSSTVSALDSKVTNQGNTIDSQGQSITKLNNDLSNLTTTVGTKADSSALNTLTSRVTNAEDTITSQGNSITSLNNSVTTINGSLATKADSSALNSLTSTVTNLGNTLTSQGTALTSIKATLGSVILSNEKDLSRSNQYSCYVLTKTLPRIAHTIIPDYSYINLYPVASASYLPEGSTLFNSTNYDHSIIYYRAIVTVDVDKTINLGTFRGDDAHSIYVDQVLVYSKNSNISATCTFSITSGSHIIDIIVNNATGISGFSSTNTLSSQVTTMFASQVSSALTASNSSALSTLNTTVTNIDGRVTNNANAITSLNSNYTSLNNLVSTKADASVLTNYYTKTQSDAAQATMTNTLESNLITATGANLIANGSFENGFDGWIKSTVPSTFTYSANNTGYEGGKSLSVSTSTNATSVFSLIPNNGKSIAVETDKTYRFSCWYKCSSDLTGSVSSNFKLRLGKFSGDFLIDKSFDPTKTDWTYIEIIYKVLGSNNVGAVLPSINLNFKTGSIFIDKIVFEDITLSQTVDTKASATALNDTNTNVSKLGNDLNITTSNLTNLTASLGNVVNYRLVANQSSYAEIYDSKNTLIKRFDRGVGVTVYNNVAGITSNTSYDLQDGGTTATDSFNSAITALTAGTWVSLIFSTALTQAYIQSVKSSLLALGISSKTIPMLNGASTPFIIVGAKGLLEGQAIEYIDTKPNTLAYILQFVNGVPLGLGSGTVAQAINSLDNSISVVDGKVTATNTNVTNLTTTVNTNQANLVSNYYTKTQADAVTTGFINSANSSLAIGGQNLWSIISSPITNVTGTGVKTTINENEEWVRLQIKTFTSNSNSVRIDNCLVDTSSALVSGEDIVVSFEIRASKSATISTINISYGAANSLSIASTAVTTNFIRVERTFKSNGIVATGSSQSINFITNSTNFAVNDWIEIRHIQVQRGTKATDYQKATGILLNNDSANANAISSLTTTTTNIGNKLESTSNNLISLSASIDTSRASASVNLWEFGRAVISQSS